LQSGTEAETGAQEYGENLFLGIQEVTDSVKESIYKVLNVFKIDCTIMCSLCRGKEMRREK